MAAAVLLCAGLFAAPACAESTTCTVHMKKASSITENSICDDLFCSTADVELDGSNACVTVYVADPVPNYADAGQSLTSVDVAYDGKTYAATLDTENKVKKSFSASKMFFPSAGSYEATPVSFTLPAQALEDSAQGKVVCTAYVNMLKSKQDFLMVFSYEDGAGEGEGADTGSQDSSGSADAQGGSSAAGGGSAGTAGTQQGSAEKTATSSSSSKKTSKKTSSSSGEIEDATQYTYRYTTSFRKAGSFGTESICNPLFYRKAQVVVVGSLAKVTIWVVDPIPSYKAEGTPLSNVKFLYGGKAYAASYQQNSKVKKSFSASSMFIPSAGSYTATPISVTLPVAAVGASAKGGLVCQAYVRAVLGQTQSFYLVLSDGTLVSTKKAAKALTASKKTTASSVKQSAVSLNEDAADASDATSADGSTAEADEASAEELAGQASADGSASAKRAAQGSAAASAYTLSGKTPAALWVLFALALATVGASCVVARRRRRG